MVDIGSAGNAHPRNFWLLIILGLLIPSGVFLWLGRWKTALGYYVIQIILSIGFLFAIVKGTIQIPSGLDLKDLQGVAVLAMLPFNAIAVIYAYILNRGDEYRPLYSRWYFAFVLAIALPFVITLPIAYALRVFIIQPFNVPSESNVPTLVPGDYFFISKLAYSYGGHPQRGDMAVFKYPGDLKIDFVKRVIGLPGDRVQLKSGVVFLNGVALDRQPVTGIQIPKGLKAPNLHFYRETMTDGRSYVIAGISDSSPSANTIEYIVPQGHYFTLGDSRDNSLDSRFLDRVGYVPEENFEGPVLWRFWNSTSFPLNDRPVELYPAAKN